MVRKTVQKTLCVNQALQCSVTFLTLKKLLIENSSAEEVWIYIEYKLHKDNYWIVLIKSISVNFNLEALDDKFVQTDDGLLRDVLIWIECKLW